MKCLLTEALDVFIMNKILSDLKQLPHTIKAWLHLKLAFIYHSTKHRTKKACRLETFINSCLANISGNTLNNIQPLANSEQTIK